MDTQTVSIGSSAEQLGLPLDYLEPRWYAAYTRAQHEKRVALQLAERVVEYYLPVYEAVHRWKDRRMRVQLPLFPGYVFIHIPLKNRLDVLRIPSVVRLVGFNGAPTPLPVEVIECLRRALDAGVCAEPHPFLRVGRRVRITAGSLIGLEGILKRWKGSVRVVLSIELIQRSILVDIESASVEPISSRAPAAGPRLMGHPIRD